MAMMMMMMTTATATVMMMMAVVVVVVTVVVAVVVVVVVVVVMRTMVVAVVVVKVMVMALGVVMRSRQWSEKGQKWEQTLGGPASWGKLSGFLKVLRDRWNEYGWIDWHGPGYQAIKAQRQTNDANNVFEKRPEFPLPERVYVM